jgi:hypothetical protein
VESLEVHSLPKPLNKHNPSRDVYKTKADVVKLMQQAVADGANVRATRA